MTAAIDAIDVDIEGSMFGSVLVVQLSEDGRHWHVLCECNEMFLAREEDLVDGLVKSCGCEDTTRRRGSWPKPPTTDLSSRWKEFALCGQLNDDSFYPDRGDRSAVAVAKKICLRCDVRVECLRWALDLGDPHGVWGGLTGMERKALLKQRKLTPTPSGFCGHCGGDDHEFTDCPDGPPVGAVA